MNNAGPILVFVYLIALLGIGVFANSRVRSTADYVLAGRSLGFWMFVMLMLGATTSGMTLLGVSGLGYVAGWPTFWEQVFVPFTCAFAIIVYGAKLFEVCRKKKFLTLQDYLAYRFSSPRAVRTVSSLAVLTTSLIYLVGQYTAIAIVLRWLLGIPETQALFLGAFIVIAYVLLGGLYAVAWSTLFQGVIIVLGVFLMTPMVISSAGGLSAINQAIGNIDPNMLRLAYPQVHPPAAAHAFATPAFLVSFVILLGLGLGSAPHIVNNVIAIRDRKYLRWSPLVVFLLYLGLMYLIKISGMGVRALTEAGLLTLERPDDAFLAGIQYALPPGLWYLFTVVILAAVMSTTDRLLLVIGTCCGWDFYHQIFNRRATDRKITLVSRASVIAFGTISFFLAIRPPALLAWLIWMGIGIMLATFVTPLLFGLYWRRANGAGALWAMSCGFAGAVFFGWWHRFIGPLPVHFSLFGFLLSIAAMIIASLLSPPPSATVLEQTQTGPFLRGKKPSPAGGGRAGA